MLKRILITTMFLLLVSVDCRALLPGKCQDILPVHQKGRPGDYSSPGLVQTAVYRTELSLGIGVPSRMPPFHSAIFNLIASIDQFRTDCPFLSVKSFG